MEPIPVVDVFAGAGGLGEGFAACPNRSAPDFRVALSIEKDPAAVRTLRLRAFFRAFDPAHVPEDYYRLLQGKKVPEAMTAYLSGDIELPALLECYDDLLPIEPGSVWHTELSDSPEMERELDQRITAAVNGRSDWVLVGGPPCQPFSTVGRSKQKSLDGYTLETDARHRLYREYLRIILRHWPAVFVMENVRGILSAKVGGEKIFPKILNDLSDPEHAFRNTPAPSTREHRYAIWPLEAAAVTTVDLFGLNAEGDGFLIESERHGIPQMRHRVILLGIRDDIQIHPKPLKSRPGNPPTVASVIDGLPRLRSGIARTPDSRDQWRQIAAAIGANEDDPALTADEQDDVIDSDAQWQCVLESALHQPWFRELEEAGPPDVLAELRRVLWRLSPPRSGRGRDWIPATSRWSSGHLEPELRAWIDDPRMDFICDHIAREHMPTDHHRYLFAAAFASVRGVSPRLRDFPPSLLPEHRNVPNSLSHSNFADRFRVQISDQPASTILSHIAKDGHYFIHPDPSQARSLSVREAARLQTFPDNYAFSGNRSEQYTQIGNAVPPLLSLQIAVVVADVIAGWQVRQSAAQPPGKLPPSFRTESRAAGTGAP